MKIIFLIFSPFLPNAGRFKAQTNTQSSRLHRRVLRRLTVAWAAPDFHRCSFASFVKHGGCAEFRSAPTSPLSKPQLFAVYR